jgi:hypothetical protein
MHIVHMVIETVSRAVEGPDLWIAAVGLAYPVVSYAQGPARPKGVPS